MKLGVAPEAVMAAYRVADSPPNVVTPLMPYFALVVTFARRYDKNARVGAVIAMMLSYGVAVSIVWILLFLAWEILGLLFGPEEGRLLFLRSFNQWGVDRKGGAAASRALRFLFTAVLVAVIAVSRAQAEESPTTMPSHWLADGIWMVQARAISNRQQCSDRLVHLTNMQGRLSGGVAFGRASVPIRNLVLLPNGNFSGSTRARLTGSKLDRSYKVSGKFRGDTVSLALEGDGCPPRHGVATRQPTVADNRAEKLGGQ